MEGEVGLNKTFGFTEPIHFDPPHHSNDGQQGLIFPSPPGEPNLFPDRILFGPMFSCEFLVNDDGLKSFHPALVPREVRESLRTHMVAVVLWSKVAPPQKRHPHGSEI